MALAAIQWLGPSRPVVRGIVVSPEPPKSLIPGLVHVAGDHPVPGSNSAAAAGHLADMASKVGAGDQVYVLLSGGTTSLIGAPVEGVTFTDYREAFQRLLGSGLDIDAMNAVRKQISRWSDGRLALALRHAMVQPVIMSDVVTDDPATIGSGPCSPSGDHSDFAHVAVPLLARHDLPVRAAVSIARGRGLRVEHGPPLTGEARDCGRELAHHLVRLANSVRETTVVIAGGETTVTLDGGEGSGGRCQELALSAAEVLSHSPTRRICLLAAGTDGRDGPTDAAGAIVDGLTWRRILEAGRLPASDLASHDSYKSLDVAGSLLRTGPTGTNMLDLVIAVVRPAAVRA